MVKTYAMLYPNSNRAQYEVAQFTFEESLEARALLFLLLESLDKTAESLLSKTFSPIFLSLVC